MELIKRISENQALIADMAKVLQVSKEELDVQLGEARKALELRSNEDAVRKQIERMARSGASLVALRALVDKAVTETQQSDVSTKIENYLVELGKVRDHYNRQEIKAGLNMGPDFQELDDKMGGLRTGGKIFGLAGRASSGKTTILRNLSLALALYNMDVFVAYVTLDDNVYEMMQHLVSQLSGVRDDLVAHTYDATEQQKVAIDKAWITITNELKDRYMIIDAGMCATLTDILALNEKLCEQHKGKKVVLMIDNFHDIRHPITDLREKNFTCVNALKDSVTACNNTLIMSIQLNKLHGGRKPTREDMSETVEIDYKGNMIMLVHNEADANPLSPELGIPVENAEGEVEIRPIIEVMVQKQKIIPRCKGSFFFRFEDSSSRLLQIPRCEVLAQDYQYRLKREFAAKSAGVQTSFPIGKRKNTEKWRG